MSVTRRTARGFVALLVTALALTGCSVAKPSAGSAESSPATTTSAVPSVIATSASPTATAKPFELTTSLTDGATVPVDHRFTATATAGTVESVTLTSTDPRPDKKTVAGALSPDRSTWTAGSLLEPGVSYTAAITARTDAGEAVARSVTFKTQSLSLKQQVFVYNIPGAGATVGVAMPVVVTFDLPVTDRASFEKNMHVTSAPAQAGSWRWISNKEAHWRPATYWQPGTQVSINIDVNGVSAGGGLYGQESKQANFTIGRAASINVDLAAHTLTQYTNGQATRTIPITGGKPGYDTRAGIKVIMERLDSVDMNAATTGVGQDSPEFYDLKDVKYAMRVTTSGEFFHAAPWSVGSQGRTNVSHGCVGMSTDNADWLMANTIVGDPAMYTGSGRQLEDNNGWTDWNLPFDMYKSGSALGG